MNGKVSQLGTFKISPSITAATTKTMVTNQTVQFSAMAFSRVAMVLFPWYSALLASGCQQLRVRDAMSTAYAHRIIYASVLAWADHPAEHREQECHEAAGKLPRIGGSIGW